MAIGDSAVADGMPLVNGNQALARDIDDLINETRDFIGVRNRNVRPITAGGTDANTAAQARANLGAADASRVVETNGGNATALIWDGSKLQLFINGNFVGFVARNNLVVETNGQNSTSLNWDGSRLQAFINGNFVGYVNLGTTDLSSRVAKSGDTMSGDLTVPNVYLTASSPANNNYAVAYIDGSGRVSKGASSARYKKHIKPIDPLELGDLFPEFTRWQMRSQEGSPTDGRWRYGYIAETIANNPATEPFAVYADLDGEQVPESIDFIGILLAQNAQLNRRLAALEAKDNT